MIRIAISVEAFEAIARTLPLGSVAVEAEPNEHGERLIWLEDAMADRLGAMPWTGRDLQRRNHAAYGRGDAAMSDDETDDFAPVQRRRRVVLVSF